MAKLVIVILGISTLTTFILALREASVANLVTSVILSSKFFDLILYSFFTTSLSLLKAAGTGTNLSTSNLSVLLCKLLKLVGTFFNLSISNLSKLVFKLPKSNF